MATSLSEMIQRNLGYPALHKIDPNTQQAVRDENTASHNQFSQAAIPAILMGLYQYVQTDPGAHDILVGRDTNYLQKIFGGKEQEIISHLADYAATGVATTTAEMSRIALEAVRVLKESFSGEGSNEALRSFFQQEKHDILSYLPASISVGQSLDNNSLDDRTQKMEGPVSNLMHKIEALFDSPPKQAD